MKFDNPIVLNFDRLIMKQFMSNHQFILVDMEGDILKSNDTLFDLTEFIYGPLDSGFPILSDYFATLKSNPQLPIEINCIQFTFKEKTRIYDIKLNHIKENGRDLILIQFYDRTVYYQRIQDKHQKNVETYLDKEVLLQQAEIIQKQNDEIKNLFKESHHRIKNNLQVIISLIGMQERDSKNKELKLILIEVQNRIHSMALLHECLYNSQNLKNVNVKIYINALVNDMMKSYNLKKNVSFTVNADEVELNSNTLVILGLLINELLSNALKHGLKDKDKGSITVEFKELKTNQFSLKISDNGVGIPNDIFIKPSKTMGVELIKMFTDQLKGTVNVLDEPGGVVQIDFSEEK